MEMSKEVLASLYTHSHTLKTRTLTEVVGNANVILSGPGLFWSWSKSDKNSFVVKHIATGAGSLGVWSSIPGSVKLDTV